LHALHTSLEATIPISHVLAPLPPPQNLLVPTENRGYSASPARDNRNAGPRLRHRTAPDLDCFGSVTPCATAPPREVCALTRRRTRNGPWRRGRRGGRPSRPGGAGSARPPTGRCSPPRSGGPANRPG